MPVPSNSCSNEGTAAGSNNFFVSCPTVFTEEQDADENGRIAVILRIIQHHCVTKMVCFDVSYGYVYVYSYGYSATTAIFDK